MKKCKTSLFGQTCPWCRANLCVLIKSLWDLWFHLLRDNQFLPTQPMFAQGMMDIYRLLV